MADKDARVRLLEAIVEYPESRHQNRPSLAGSAEIVEFGKALTTGVNAGSVVGVLKRR